MSFSLVGLLNLVTLKDPRSKRLAAGISYGERPLQRLDVYGPADGRRGTPVLAFFYGGAWTEGDRRDFGFVARWFAARGYLVVVPDHRAVPEVEYPVFLEDCAAAVHWAIANAARFGGDAGRLALIGHSAGAYNAAMIALDPSYRLAGAVRAVVGLSGPYDFHPFDVPISVRVFGQSPDPLRTQPVNLVTPTSPPMLLASGDDDVVVGPHNTKGLALALRAQGVDVDERHYPGFKHPQTLLEFGTFLTRNTDLAPAVLAFISRHLGTRASETVVAAASE